jgi:hypothetical protein
MALFDSTLLFYHTGNVYNLTAGEFVSVAGIVGTSSSVSTAINLGNPRDLGIGPGAEIPQVVAIVGTAFTSASSSQLINLQFRGSTDSVNWTVYYETTPASTASWQAGTQYVFDVPSRPTDPLLASQLVALPLYYDLNLNLTGGGAATISTGTILAGIVLAAPQSASTLGAYPAGFSVA